MCGGGPGSRKEALSETPGTQKKGCVFGGNLRKKPYGKNGQTGATESGGNKQSKSTTSRQSAKKEATGGSEIGVPPATRSALAEWQEGGWEDEVRKGRDALKGGESGKKSQLPKERHVCPRQRVHQQRGGT